MKSDFESIIALLIIGGGLLVHAVRAHRRVRHVADTPRSKTESAPQGLVELEGFAWPAAEPFRNSSNQDAVYYSLSIQRQESRGSGKNRRKVWVNIYTHVHSDPFYLVDATGLVTIDTTKAELNLSDARIRPWHKMSALEKDKILAVVPSDVVGFPPSSRVWGMFSNSYRIVENEILVGCPLYATGDFRSSGSEATSLKLDGLTAFTQKVFDAESRTLKNRQQILDGNRDGRVTDEELRSGSVATARVARDTAGSNLAHEAEFKVHGNIARNAQSGVELFLADTFEGPLKERLGKWLWPKFAAGAAMVALGLGMMLTPGTAPQAARANVPLTGQVALMPAQRKPASVAEFISQQHAYCVRGQLASCNYLLVHQGQLRLPPNYVAYYKSKLRR